MLKETGAGFAEPFLTAPSPGIIATAMLNEHYDTEDAYLAALGEALRVEYETIVRHGYVLQIDAPDLAMERHITYQDRPLAEFVEFVERVIATINSLRSPTCREKKSGCMSAGATIKARTIQTCRCATSCPC